MSLSDVKIKNAKPGERMYKLADEKGLYMVVSPKGGKWWRFDFRFGDKRKTLSLGTYPDVGLKRARERRDEAWRLLAEEIDPAEHRKAAKASTSGANSLETVAREWFAKYKPG